MKHYGSDKTNLKLHGNALEAYNITDPLDIYEIDGCRYNVSGCMEAENITETELIEMLESLLD